MANPMDAPPSLPFVCPCVSASLFCLAVRWSGCLLIVGLLVHAQRHTTDAGARLHFGCTADDQPFITLHAADWADNLGQLHQALEATLGAHMLITPLDLTRAACKLEIQIRDLVRHDNFVQLCTYAWGSTKCMQCNRGRGFEKCDFLRT